MSWHLEHAGFMFVTGCVLCGTSMRQTCMCAVEVSCGTHECMLDSAEVG